MLMHCSQDFLSALTPGLSSGMMKSAIHLSRYLQQHLTISGAVFSRAALRQVGTNVSPALGYFDTPALNLKSVTPLAGAPPAPIPAGAYDVGLSYASQGNALCLNGSASARSVFVVQVPHRLLLYSDALRKQQLDDAERHKHCKLTIHIIPDCVTMPCTMSSPRSQQTRQMKEFC